jgi:hypothetical protein
MYYALYDCNFNLLAQTTMYTRNIGSNLKDDHIYYVYCSCLSIHGVVIISASLLHYSILFKEVINKNMFYGSVQFMEECLCIDYKSIATSKSN